MPACEQCGFDYDSVASAEVPGALISIGEALGEGLSTADGEALRRRPRPEVWSALEYACHVRDVLLVQRDRLFRALVEDTPDFARMHREERLVLERYNDQDPRAVEDQVGVAAQLAAGAFACLDGAQWRRPLRYNWPDNQVRDVRWLAAHTIHEGRHHLGDFAAVVSGQAPGQG
ncbi:MAG TPA: DinB family protein [Acidimicrobiales bacterium]